MSAQISFDTSERRLADKNAIKLNTAQVESNISRSEGSPEKEINTDKAQGSASVEPKTFPVEPQTRKVDYYIEQGSNEVVVKIRDGESGEVIRQIPQEEFLRLTNRISEFNKNIIDSTV
jgi:flagellar protein FlaG